VSRRDRHRAFYLNLLVDLLASGPAIVLNRRLGPAVADHRPVRVTDPGKRGGTFAKVPDVAVQLSG